MKKILSLIFHICCGTALIFLLTLIIMAMFQVYWDTFDPFIELQKRFQYITSMILVFFAALFVITIGAASGLAHQYFFEDQDGNASNNPPTTAEQV